VALCERHKQEYERYVVQFETHAGVAS